MSITEQSLKINNFETAILSDAFDQACSTSKINQLSNYIISELKINQLMPNVSLKTNIQYVSSIFQQCGFPQNDYHIKGIKDVCFWTSLCFPKTDSNTLNLFSLIMAYTSVVDDACDSEKDIDGTLRNELQQHVNILKSYSSVDLEYVHENPSINLLQFIIKEIKSQLSTRQLCEITQAMTLFYENSKEIANMWVSEEDPELAHYIRLREFDSLAHMLLVLKSVECTSNPTRLNARYFQLCEHASLIANDICSLPKDLKSGIRNNYVLLLKMNTVELAMEHSLIHMIQILKEMKEIEDNSNSIELEEMKSIARGYVGWCFKSPRFHHSNHLISCLVKEDQSSSSCITTQRNDTEPITYLDVLKANKKIGILKYSKQVTILFSILNILICLLLILSNIVGSFVMLLSLILGSVLLKYTPKMNTTRSSTSHQPMPVSPGRNIAI